MQKSKNDTSGCTVLITLKSTTRLLILIRPCAEMGANIQAIAKMIQSNIQTGERFLLFEDIIKYGVLGIFLDGQQHISCQMFDVFELESFNVMFEKIKPTKTYSEEGH